MGKLIEGFWDCKYCGNKRIRGSIRECPNCGKARDNSTKFYLDASERNYVSEEKAAKINKNPDWVCNYCNQLNSDDDDICVSCGAPRTSENLNYFENQKRNEEKNRKNVQSIKEKSNSSSSKKTNTEDSLRSSSKKIINSKILVEIFYKLISFLLCVAFFWGIAAGIRGTISFFKPKEHSLIVSELSWKRSIDVERYQTVKENDWFLPQNGRLLYTRSEYSHSEQVLDHYESRTRSIKKERISDYAIVDSDPRDLGNGYFEETTEKIPIYETYYETELYDEPIFKSKKVYLTRYYYEIDKWLYERSVKTSGINNSPYWGKTNLSSDERESLKSETYTVKGIDIDDNEKELSFTISLEKWSTVQVGQTLKVKISFWGRGEIIE